MFLCHLLDIQVQRTPPYRPCKFDSKAKKGVPVVLMCSSTSGTNGITPNTEIV